MKQLLIGFVFSFLFCPCALAQSTVSGFDPGNIKIQTQGSQGTIKMGESGRLAQFRLSNPTKHKLKLKSLRLRNYGSARLSESFESLALTHNHQTVAQAVPVNRQYVHFKLLDPLVIDRGNSLALTVEGRLTYARTGRTVQLGLQYAEDLHIELAAAPGFSVACAHCRGTRFKTQRLKPGSVRLSRRSPYRAARYYGSRRRTSQQYVPTPNYRQTYSQGAKGVTFFSTFINSQVDFSLEGLFLSLDSGSQVSDKNGNRIANEMDDFNATFSDFSLYINGRKEDSTRGLTLYQGRVGLFFDSWLEVNANSQIVVSGRITHQASSGDKIKFGLSRQGLIDPVYLHSGDSVNLGNINGGATSNFSESSGDEPLNISK